MQIDLGLADLALDLLDEFNHRGKAVTAEFHRLYHLGLRHVLTAGLYHDDLIRSACHHNIRVAGLTLGERRIDLPFPVDATDTDAADRAGPGN